MSPVILDVTIKLLSPMYIGVGYEFTHLKRCKDYIPGIVLRGAFETAITEIYGDKDIVESVHNKIFQKYEMKNGKIINSNKKGNAYFRPAYPMIEETKLLPCPQNVSYCPKCGKLLRDKPICPEHNEKCKRIKWISEEGLEMVMNNGEVNEKLNGEIPKKRKIWRISLETSKGTVKEGPFVYEAIEKDECFHTRIILLKDFVKEFINAAKYLEDSGIGALTKMGFGEVEIKIKQSQHEPNTIKSLDKDEISITALSPIITSSPDVLKEVSKSDLRINYEPELRRLELSGYNGSVVPVRGWSLEYKRRNLQFALDKGSVIFYKIGKNIDKEKLIDEIKRAQIFGIGKNSMFGFGWIMFH